jgi:hypothetical protein
MFNVIYLPSGTVVSQHSTIEDAQVALAIVETNPSSHEIIEVTDGDN